MVYGAAIDYHKPARLNDRLAVSARRSRGRARPRSFRAAVQRGDEVLVSARVTVGVRDRADMKPVAMPEALTQRKWKKRMIVTHDLSILSMILQRERRRCRSSWRCCSSCRCCPGTYIFLKFFTIRQARRQTEQFERDFWSGTDLNAPVPERGRAGATRPGPGAHLRGRLPGITSSCKTQRARTRRLRRRHAARDARDLPARDGPCSKSHLAFLASVGSVSPYVGLLGTVWGIMHSFRGLSNVAQATLAAVAPGIAEALVATAIGLFAAIPAVVAYNRFCHDIDRLAVRFESFMEEFSNILQRQAHDGGDAAMRPAERPRLMNQINVVPYVDVMLVLLVIFMVTAPLVTPGQVDLPSVGKASQPPAAPLEVRDPDRPVDAAPRARQGAGGRPQREHGAARHGGAQQQANPRPGGRHRRATRTCATRRC